MTIKSQAIKNNAFESLNFHKNSRAIITPIIIPIINQNNLLISTHIYFKFNNSNMLEGDSDPVISARG